MIDLLIPFDLHLDLLPSTLKFVFQILSLHVKGLMNFWDMKDNLSWLAIIWLLKKEEKVSLVSVQENKTQAFI